ncbi:MAG TPA: M56 family metallopeptidase, partial [Chthonomonadaceae bacterium]|nr:M56 family metallopeptidase [Chthonomonadaceae bacterium]
MNLLQGAPWHAYVQPIGWTLVHFLWQGAVIALLLSMTLLFLRTRSANARYLAATLALGGMALCPPLTLAVLTSRQAQALPGSGATLVFDVPASEGSAALQPALSLQQTALPGGSITASPASGMNGLLPGLVAAWLLGVLLLSARLLGGWVRVQRLMRRAARPIEDPVAARCAALARRMGIARPVALRASAAVQVPAMAGCLRAVILFPAGALSGLPAWQIEALLAHELAHVRRHDYLINLAQSLIETLLFYHPGVWWVSRQIRIERELCCDDLVVQVLDDRVGYARALTTLEQMRSQPASPALAATDGDLLARVRRILGLPSEKVRITPLPSSGTFSL